MFPPLAILLILPAADVVGPLTVHPTRGQELVYRGTIAEESRTGPSPDRRQFDLEARVFVLDSGTSAAEIGLLTILRAPAAALDANGSARLELANVSPSGRIVLSKTGTSPLVPLDGPPSLEPVGFVEFPSRQIDSGSTWDVRDGARPPREWHVDGVEFRNGIRCWKLAGTQQSANWDRPTGDTPSWRRTDVAWVAAQSGLVLRLERSIDRRAGGDGSAGYRSRVEYELVESLTYPDQLAADRRREVQQIGQLNHALSKLPSGSEHRGRVEQCQVLLTRVDGFLASQAATPYRPAAMAIKQRVVAALRGESPPPLDAPELPTDPPAIGRPAPDFVTSDLATAEPVRLSRYRGKPALLLFVRPDAPSASASLSLTQELHRRYGVRIQIALLVVADEERARPAWLELGVPLWAGRDPAISFAVNAPSRAFVLDANGVVRYIGNMNSDLTRAIDQLAGD